MFFCRHNSDHRTGKVHIFSEGHKNMKTIIYLLFILCTVQSRFSDIKINGNQQYRAKPISISTNWIFSLFQT